MHARTIVCDGTWHMPWVWGARVAQLSLANELKSQHSFTEGSLEKYGGPGRQNKVRRSKRILLVDAFTNHWVRFLAPSNPVYHSFEFLTCSNAVSAVICQLSTLHFVPPLPLQLCRLFEGSIELSPAPANDFNLSVTVMSLQCARQMPWTTRECITWSGYLNDSALPLS